MAVDSIFRKFLFFCVSSLVSNTKIFLPIQTPIEDQPNKTVTHRLVYRMLDEIIEELRHTMTSSMADCKRLVSAKYMLMEIVTAKYYIEYLTTYLNDSHKFRSLHNKNEGLQAKL